MTAAIRSIATLLLTLASVLDSATAAVRYVVGRWTLDARGYADGWHVAYLDCADRAVALLAILRSARLTSSITYTDRSGARPRTATAASCNVGWRQTSIVILGRPVVEVAHSPALTHGRAIGGAATAAALVWLACPALIWLAQR